MKIILITGTSRGIGYETAIQLAEAGNVVIATCRNPIDLQTKKLAEMPNVYIQKLDVTNEKDVLRVCNFVRKKLGHLDVLINNAGIGEVEQSTIRRTISKIKTMPLVRKIYPILKPIAKRISNSSNSINRISAPDVRAKQITETNFYGPWLMCCTFHNLLINGSEAQIINVSSGMGLLQNLTGYLPAYSLSKASLNALTVLLANVYKYQNIRVNAVCPGWVKTDMGGDDAPLSVKEGADTIVWLANGGSAETGKFFKNRQIIEWQ